MNKIKILILVLALVAIIPLACTKGTDHNMADNQSTTENNGPNSAENTGQNSQDEAITAAVKTKIEADEQVRDRLIDIETHDALVSLRGTVATQPEADHAVQLAEQVEGVRQVRSFLKVDEENDETGTADNDSNDSGIAQDLKETGKDVGNQVERGIDKIQEKTADAAITAEVKLKLAKDELVDAKDINVNTKNGKVTLQGTVSSKAEEKRAIQIAQSVDDVRSVNSDLSIQ